MKLENEFSVAASIEDTWGTLLDIERVARCLPGATIEAGDEDGVYHGAMKMKLGPMNVQYKGTAKLQDVDEDTHTASIAVQAREAKGQGTAAAIISNHLEQVNGKTRVVAVTDLKITGRQAQFGRGMMEDVATSMMKQFATRLEEEIQSGGGAKAEKPAEPAASSASSASSGPAPGAPPASAPRSDDDDVLDVGNVLANTQMIRYAGIAGGAILLLLAIFALISGRKRRITFNINLRR
jgi:carbon monoxide dehydrogenase subunit G